MNLPKKVHFNHFNPCTAWASFTGESGGEIRWSHALPQLQGCSDFSNLFSYFSSNNILHYMSFYIICHKLCYFLKDFMFINVFIRFPSYLLFQDKGDSPEGCWWGRKHMWDCQLAKSVCETFLRLWSYQVDKYSWLK